MLLPFLHDKPGCDKGQKEFVCLILSWVPPACLRLSSITLTPTHLKRGCKAKVSGACSCHSATRISIVSTYNVKLFRGYQASLQHSFWHYLENGVQKALGEKMANSQKRSAKLHAVTQQRQIGLSSLAEKTPNNKSLLHRELWRSKRSKDVAEVKKQTLFYCIRCSEKGTLKPVLWVVVQLLYISEEYFWPLWVSTGTRRI